MSGSPGPNANARGGFHQNRRQNNSRGTRGGPCQNRPRADGGSPHQQRPDRGGDPDPDTTSEGLECERHRQLRLQQSAEIISNLEQNNPTSSSAKNRAPDHFTFEVTNIDFSPLYERILEAAALLSHAREEYDEEVDAAVDAVGEEEALAAGLFFFCLR